MSEKSPAIEEDIARQYKKFQTAPKFNNNSEELYCICRQPDHGGKLMVCCNGCDEWYHFQCMKLPLGWSRLILEFYCLFCEWRGLGVTKWKKKCRLTKCSEPIRADSKYCTDEHGLEYMTLLLAKQKTAGELKQVLSHVTDYQQFEVLGSEFPELPAVLAFKETGVVEPFPEDVQKNLQIVSEKSAEIAIQVDKFTARSEYLLQLKESLKQANEKLLVLLGLVQKTKKKPGKKLDICFYDKKIDSKGHSIDNVDFEELSGVCKRKHIEDDYEENTFHTICIKDKKKCLRHNGWWNLAADECGRKLVELGIELDSLTRKRDGILKEYSVGEYERQL